jgi:hypothetical protein
MVYQILIIMHSIADRFYILHENELSTLYLHLIDYYEDIYEIYYEVYSL